MIFDKNCNTDWSKGTRGILFGRKKAEIVSFRKQADKHNNDIIPNIFWKWIWKWIEQQNVK